MPFVTKRVLRFCLALGASIARVAKILRRSGAGCKRDTGIGISEDQARVIKGIHTVYE